MAVIQPSSLTTTVQTRYETAYREIQDRGRTYEQLAGNMKETDRTEGSSVTVSFGSDIEPNISAGSRTSDPTPQMVYEASTTVTPEYYDGTVQMHETVLATSFAFGIERLGKLAGKAKLETDDYLARQAAVNGTWVIYPGSNTTRATLDLGTAGDHVTDAMLLKTKMFTNSWFGNKLADGSAIAIMDDFVFGDILAGGQVDDITNYQDKNIMLNYELGKAWGLRFVVSPLAKAFYGAGAANSSACSSTLNGAINPLATSCVVTTIGSAAKNQWFTLGTVESSSTGYPTTEIVYATDVTSSTITFHGGGVNGGCRFAHADGAAIVNADTVHPVVIGGPYSLGKVYSKVFGEYGQLVGPKTKGDLDQFWVAGYKHWVGYGRVNEAQLIRIECSSTNQ